METVDPSEGFDPLTPCHSYVNGAGRRMIDQTPYSGYTHHPACACLWGQYSLGGGLAAGMNSLSHALKFQSHGLYLPVV